MPTADEMKQEFRKILLAIENGLNEIKASWKLFIKEANALEGNLSAYYALNEKLIEQQKIIRSAQLLGMTNLESDKKMLVKFDTVLNEFIKNGVKMSEQLTQLMNQNSTAAILTGHAPIKSSESIEAMNKVKENMNKVLAELAQQSKLLKQGLRSSEEHTSEEKPSAPRPGHSRS